MMKKVALWCALVAAFLAFQAGAAEAMPEFTALENFPSPSPASGAVVDVLGDGRFIVWDGATVFVQDGVGVDGFSPLAGATGYVGDPAFIEVAPDGHTCILGTGYADSNNIYAFDVNDPQPKGTPLISANHYTAVMLDATHLLIDSAQSLNPGEYEAELGIIDLSASNAMEYRTVVPAKGGASAAMCLDTTGTIVYATDGLTGLTRTFAVSDLVNAYDTDTPISWSTGTNVGTLNGGGAVAMMPGRTLVVGGYGVQFATEEGEVIGSVDPGGAGAYVSVCYNPVTSKVLVLEPHWPAQWGDPIPLSAYISEDLRSVFANEAMPACGTLGLIAAAAAVAAIARRKMRS